MKFVAIDNSLSRKNPSVARASVECVPRALSRHAHPSHSSSVVCGRIFCRSQICRDTNCLCRDIVSPCLSQLCRDRNSHYTSQVCRDIKSSVATLNSPPKAKSYRDTTLTVATRDQKSLLRQRILCLDRNPKMGSRPLFCISCTSNPLPIHFMQYYCLYTNSTISKNLGTLLTLH